MAYKNLERECGLRLVKIKSLEAALEKIAGSRVDCKQSLIMQAIAKEAMKAKS
jgi:hypothetical protein